MSLTKWFPNLTKTNYRITSPCDGNYNCVAWVLGDDTQWWQANAGYYWPLDRIPDDEEPSVDHVLRLFVDRGFESCPTSKRSPDYDHVAIYSDGDRFTHIARQLEDGWWTSKIGPDEDIEHETLEALEGDFFGQVSVVMRRSKLWATESQHPAT